MLYNLHICQLAHSSRPEGEIRQECVSLLLESTYATMTNANFDEACFDHYLHRAADLVVRLAAQAPHAPPSPLGLPASLPHDRSSLFFSAGPAGLLARSAVVGDDELFGVVEMATYGWKGVVAHLYHAERLQAGGPAYSDTERAEVYQELFRVGSYLAQAGSCRPLESHALDRALAECFALGALNLKVIKMLDAVHCHKFGSPSPTDVPTTPRLGRQAVLVSGHDLHTLHSLLLQTRGQGIDVYTHGDLLAAHGYPELRKFENLAGHFGTHWVHQVNEFRHFPGPILMTSNCLQPPTRKYADRLWTSGPAGFHGVLRLSDDFSPLIGMALDSPSVDETASCKMLACGVAHTTSLRTGFGHEAMREVVDDIAQLIRSGTLKHIFVIGGGDGTELRRSYFRELALHTPADSIILTFGCVKFRLYEHGTLAGRPRLFDMGQSSDVYSVLVVVTMLAEALGCSVHDLPLHFAVSWFEQKALAVLLTLLHLELQDIRIGPAAPAFLTSKVLGLLNGQFGLRAVDLDHADDDLAEMIRGH